MGTCEDRLGGIIYGLLCDDTSKKTWTLSEICEKVNEDKHNIKRTLEILKQNQIIVQNSDGNWLIPDNENEAFKNTGSRGGEDISVDAIVASLETTRLEEPVRECHERQERGRYQGGNSFSDDSELHAIPLTRAPDRSATVPKQPLHTSRTTSEDVTHLKERCPVKSLGSDIHTTFPGAGQMQVMISDDTCIQENRLKIVDLELRKHYDVFSRIIEVFKSGEMDLPPSTISQKANIGQSKKGANPYLYSLEKKEILTKKATEKNAHPKWSMKVDPNSITDKDLLEWAAEHAKKSGGASSVHHHHHHTNLFQAGKVNKVQIIQDSPDNVGAEGGSNRGSNH